MYSCLPEHVIENYSQCMRWNQRQARTLEAYLFWGAEYWLLRERQGDPRTCGHSPACSSRPELSEFAPGDRRPAPRPT